MLFRSSYTIADLVPDPAWMWQQIEEGLRTRFREHAGIKAALPELSRAVEAGSVTPTAAAHRLLAMLNRFF